MAALAPPAGAQVPLTRLTVNEAVAAALQHNPSLRAKTLELGSTQANEITAGLRPNPVGSYLAEQLGNRNVDSQQTVTLGQPIETGGKRRRRLESARAATAVTTEEIADARRQVILLVRKAFTVRWWRGPRRAGRGQPQDARRGRAPAALPRRAW